MEEIDVPNPTCRAQNCSLESLFLDDAEQHQPPACATACGRGQRFAVCCGPLLPRCGQGCCRQSLPPPTTAGPAAPPAAAGPHGFGPAFLDSGVSVVQRLANVFAHRKNPKRCCGGTGRGGGAIGVGVQAGEARSARPFSLTTLNNISLLAVQHQGERSMFRCLLWAIAAAVRPKALLIADNLYLRQQLLVLHRRKPRPRLEDGTG